MYLLRISVPDLHAGGGRWGSAKFVYTIGLEHVSKKISNDSNKKN